MPLLAGEANSVREALLTGVWGREVVLVTDRHKYVRAPAGANAPLSMLSNRWSTMPTHGALDAKLALPFPDDRAFLDHMPGSDLPVIHQTWRDGDRVPFWAWVRMNGNHVYDLADDPDEMRNLVGGPLEAPATQLERLGFS